MIGYKGGDLSRTGSVDSISIRKTKLGLDTTPTVTVLIGG